MSLCGPLTVGDVWRRCGGRLGLGGRLGPWDELWTTFCGGGGGGGAVGRMLFLTHSSITCWYGGMRGTPASPDLPVVRLVGRPAGRGVVGEHLVVADPDGLGITKGVCQVTCRGGVWVESPEVEGVIES